MQRIARRVLIDGLVAFDRERGWRGAVQRIDVAGDWGVAAGRHRNSDRPAAMAARRGAAGRPLQGHDRLAPAARGRRQPGRRARGGRDPLRRGEMGQGCRAAAAPKAVTDVLNPGDVVWVAPKNPHAAHRRVVADANPRDRRRPDRHGPAHGAGACGGRRLLVLAKPVRPRPAGQAPARLLLQAVRLCHRARQRLQADQHRARRADRDRAGRRQGSLDAQELRRHQVLRPLDAARRHREIAQPDDGAAGPGHGHADDRRVLQALRRLRRPAAGARHVARCRRDDAGQAGGRLLDVCERRQAREADADRPHPGPLGPDHLALRRPRVPGLQGGTAGRARPSRRCPRTTASRSSTRTPPTRSHR